jgi:hypothetical protein
MTTFLDLDDYSRVRVLDNPITEDFTFYHLDGDLAFCVADSGHTFTLVADTLVEYICSMKEYDLKKLNNEI